MQVLGGGLSGGWAPWGVGTQARSSQPASVCPVRCPGGRHCLPVTVAHDPATEHGSHQLPVLIRCVWNSCHAVSRDGQALGAGNHLPACRHGALGPVRGSSVPRSAAGDPVNGVEHLSVASLP